MADKKKERRRLLREHHSATGKQNELPDFQVKEYNYVLRVLPEDRKLLESCRESLASGTAGFAEVYYNFLFDNPDIADVLYAYERSGGDVGMLVRSELETMLAGIIGTTGNSSESKLVTAGQRLLENGFRPVWIIS